MARGKRLRSIGNEDDHANVDDNNNGTASNGKSKDTGGPGLVDDTSEPHHYDTICMFTVDLYRQEDPDQAPGNADNSQINVFTIQPYEIWRTFQRYYRMICTPCPSGVTCTQRYRADLPQTSTKSTVYKTTSSSTTRPSHLLTSASLSSSSSAALVTITPCFASTSTISCRSRAPN